MNYVFFGTPEFAAIILEKLIGANMPPVAVICNPDRPVGRKKIITPPPVKARIMNNELGIRDKIKILQPEKLDTSFHNSLFTIHHSFDFAVVAAYAKIIPKSIIELFPKGVIGVHPSLLPKYRGASPIQSAILGGEKETGVTLYMLDEKMDHGPILAQRGLEFSIFNFQFSKLHDALAELGGNLLVETLPKFVEGKIEPRAQNEAEATFMKKFTTQDGFVDEKDLSAALAGDAAKASEINRKIRALNPEPGVWTYANGLSEWAHANKIGGGKRVKLLEAKIENGKFVLTKIQEEGGRPKILVR